MATLRLAAGARAQRRTADHIVAQLRERLNLAIVPLPRLPTPEVGPGGSQGSGGPAGRRVGRLTRLGKTLRRDDASPSISLTKPPICEASPRSGIVAERPLARTPHPRRTAGADPRPGGGPSPSDGGPRGDAPPSSTAGWTMRYGRPRRSADSFTQSYPVRRRRPFRAHARARVVRRGRDLLRVRLRADPHADRRTPDPPRPRLRERVGVRPDRLAQRRKERVLLRRQHLGRAGRRADHRPDDHLVGVGRELGRQDVAHVARVDGRDPHPAARAALRQQAAGAELGAADEPVHRAARRDGHLGVRAARRGRPDRVLRSSGRTAGIEGRGRPRAAALRAGLWPAPRRQPDDDRQRLRRRRFGGPGPQVAHRAGPDVRRRVQPRLLAGGAGSGHPEPQHVRDVPAREAPVFPGGDRRLLVPDAGLLFAAHRQRAGAAVAAQQCDQRPERSDHQRAAGRHARARHHLRRRQAGGPPEPELDDRRPVGGHRRQQRAGGARNHDRRPPGRTGDRVQRPATEARTGQPRPHRLHRHGREHVRRQHDIPRRRTPQRPTRSSVRRARRRPWAPGASTTRTWAVSTSSGDRSPALT